MEVALTDADGSGIHPNADAPGEWRLTCIACSGHGTVLGSFAPALAEQVAAAIESEAA